LKAEEKTEITIILVVILIGRREIAKRVSKVILKGMTESLRKINLGKVKIMGEKELEMDKSAGSMGKGAFPVGVSEQAGKQGVVELYGVSSAGTEKSPQYVYFINNCSCNIIDDVCCCDVHIINQSSFKNNKTENNLKDFYFAGQLNNKNCIFKIDTGSDISIVNRNLIASNKVKFELNNCCLKYPTGEKVVIKEKVFVKVRLGKCSRDSNWSKY